MSANPIERPSLFGSIALFIAGIGCLIGLAGAGRVACAPVNGAIDAVEKTFEGDNIVYNYEWFHRAAGEIRTLDEQVRNAHTAWVAFDFALPKDRAQWDRADREESNRLHTVLTGTLNERSRAVNEYNARARMANRKIFRTGDPTTPDHFDTLPASDL